MPLSHSSKPSNRWNSLGALGHQRDWRLAGQVSELTIPHRLWRLSSSKAHQYHTLIGIKAKFLKRNDASWALAPSHIHVIQSSSFRSYSVTKTYTRALPLSSRAQAIDARRGGSKSRMKARRECHFLSPTSLLGLKAMTCRSRRRPASATSFGRSSPGSCPPPPLRSGAPRSALPRCTYMRAQGDELAPT